MKKKMICGVLAAMLMASQTAFAEPFYLAMSGTTNDPSALGATILVVDKNADMNDISANEIFYVDQTNINPDGSYKIVLPFFAEEGYNVISNMQGFDFTEQKKEKVLYVSDAGNDSAAGTAEAPLKTLKKAYESIADLKEVVVSGTVAYTDVPVSYAGNLTIKGTAGATLTLPTGISIKGDLTLDNVALSGVSTIYANGNNLTVNDTVTSDSRLTVYGATNGTAYTGNTNITLLGGLYYRVYGGGSANVIGNTNVTLGGNANAGDGNDDQASNISPCYVYGGSSAGTVTGETNVTLAGNAATKMIYGAGAAGGATKTNIYITGGKVMNVFGGGPKDVTIDGCETNITITGGLAEALIGGSEESPMTNSHTHVNLLGGDVSRRVYTGCYNNTTTSGFSVSMTTTHFVGGTTTLTIGKNAKVNSKTGLHSENQKDIGVYCGSRLKSANANEKNTLIFLDGCYSSFSGVFGSQDLSGMMAGLKHNPNYTVKATAGGTITVPNAAGTISLAPDTHYLAQIGSKIYGAENVSISMGTTDVTFTKNFAIDSLTANVTDTGLKADVGLSATNLTGKSQPQIIVAIYDVETEEMVTCKQVDTTTTMTSQTFDFTCNLTAGKTYYVKAMLWSADVEPLTTAYKIQIQK